LFCEFITIACAIGRVIPLLNGHHFRNIARDHQEDGMVPSAILFYSRDCFRTVMRMKFSPKNFPERGLLFFGTYDFGIFEKERWQQYEIDLDLAKWWNIEECGLAFIRPDLTLGGFWKLPKESPEMWRKWLWTHLDTNVRFMNGLRETIELWSPNAIIRNMKPGEEDVFRISAGHKLAAKINGRVVWNYVQKYDDDCQDVVILRADSDSWKEVKGLTTMFNKRDQSTSFTASTNWYQPPHLPHTTKGYRKTKMPRKLFKELMDFYHENRGNISRDEGLAAHRTGINGYKIQPTMVSLDHDRQLRNRVANTYVKPIVEAWVNQSLEFTSFYGIRVYHWGNHLRMHVDRLETHIYSVIMQLDQVGVEEDWPLEIVDFTGKRREISMVPGDLILYESAKLIHGRPKTLYGKEYANAFCHFKPLVWPYEDKNDILHHHDRPLQDFKLICNIQGFTIPCARREYYESALRGI